MSICGEVNKLLLRSMLSLRLSQLGSAPSQAEVMYAHNPWVTRHSRGTELSKWQHAGSSAIASTYVNSNVDGVPAVVRGNPIPYRQYVGAASLWEHGEVAASIFELLHRCGFGESSTLLEIGCGSLRFGRLAITFLLPGRYACIEPQEELVRAAIRFELGADIIRLKRPRFAFNAAFDPPTLAKRNGDGADTTFEYMLAQSIFTHTAGDMLDRALTKLKPNLAQNAVLFATFFLSDPPRIHAPAFAVNAYNASGWLWKGTTASFTYFPLSRLRHHAMRIGLEMAVMPLRHANNMTWVAFTALGSSAFRTRPGIFRFRQTNRP